MTMKTLLLAAAFASASALTAMAQSSPPGSSSPGSSQTGPSAQQPSASPPPASPSMGAGSSQNVTAATHCKNTAGQVQVKGTVGSGSTGAMTNVSPSVVATLPNC
jgi:hypothetical protein